MGFLLNSSNLHFRNKIIVKTEIVIKSVGALILRKPTGGSQPNPKVLNFRVTNQTPGFFFTPINQLME
jgi:hypothetical protein